MTVFTRGNFALTAAGVAALALGGSALAATATPHAARAATHAIRVDAAPSGKLEFLQRRLTARAGNITFVLHNASKVPHNLAIKGNGLDDEQIGPPSATISGGKTATLHVKLKPGKYEFYCEVPGHERAGMKGVLIVK
jgi:uncharacterized cupredoxin-like copper-binding protein